MRWYLREGSAYLVYTRGALHSLRYNLTVHNQHQCHLDELDMVAQGYLKRWLGLPSRGATSAGIFSPLVLAVKPVSQVFMEGHLGAYVNSYLVADSDTREALRCAEERKVAWTKKSSTLIQCRNIFQEMQEEDECFIPTPENTNTFTQTIRVKKPKILKVAKQKVTEIFQKKPTSIRRKE